MKVLIAGALGLLGGHLLTALKKRGEQIRALVLPAESAEQLSVQGTEVIRGYVTDPAALTLAIKNIDFLIHLAGMMGVNRPFTGAIKS